MHLESHRDMNATYLKNKITVHLFLLQWQKRAVWTHTSLEIKKKKSEATAVLLVLYLWIPLVSLLVWSASSKSSFLKFPCFSTSSLTKAELRASTLLLFRFLMKVGATQRVGIHKHMYHLPWIRPESSWGDALRPLPYCREGSKVTAVKCSSLWAKSAHKMIKTNALSTSYQWSFHCWSNLRIEG